MIYYRLLMFFKCSWTVAGKAKTTISFRWSNDKYFFPCKPIDSILDSISKGSINFNLLLLAQGWSKVLSLSIARH